MKYSHVHSITIKAKCKHPVSSEKVLSSMSFAFKHLACSYLKTCTVLNFQFMHFLVIKPKT